MQSVVKFWLKIRLSKTFKDIVVTWRAKFQS